MSADLLVFEKDKAPLEPMTFLDWFLEKAEWSSDRDYSDIKGTSEKLTNFFMELKNDFPAMNGPYAIKDDELEKDPGKEERVTDYTIDDDLIYMGFAWSAADEAEEKVKALALKYDLGFFDMFNIYLDEKTVIPVPQIGADENDGTEKKKGHKTWIQRLFGK